MTKAELLALAEMHEEQGALKAKYPGDAARTQQAAKNFAIAAALRAMAERMDDD